MKDASDSQFHQSLPHQSLKTPFRNSLPRQRDNSNKTSPTLVSLSFPSHGHSTTIPEVIPKMSSDTRLPPQAPMINGHGEADTYSAPSRRTLSEVCADLHRRVSAFLSAPATDGTIASTQEQTRIALAVIEKALEDHT